MLPVAAPGSRYSGRHYQVIRDVFYEHRTAAEVQFAMEPYRMLSRRQGMNQDVDTIAYGGPRSSGRSVEAKGLKDVVAGKWPKRELWGLDAVLVQRAARNRQAVDGKAQRIRVDQIG